MKNIFYFYNINSIGGVESMFYYLAKKYCDKDIVPTGNLKDVALKCENEKIYNQLETKEIYIQAIIDYISGMTDRFAIAVFNDLLQY